MKRLQLAPKGWPCTFSACPAGLFVHGDTVCFRDGYDGKPYLHDGQAWWGGVSGESARDSLIVQPVAPEWVEDEE